jgi:hypothetical protein
MTLQALTVQRVQLRMPDGTHRPYTTSPDCVTRLREGQTSQIYVRETHGTDYGAVLGQHGLALCAAPSHGPLSPDYAPSFSPRGTYLQSAKSV